MGYKKMNQEISFADLILKDSMGRYPRAHARGLQRIY